VRRSLQKHGAFNSRPPPGTSPGLVYHVGSRRSEPKENDDVKILLRNLTTGLFLDEFGGWSLDSNLALKFRSTAAAHDHCQNHRCGGAVIILRFANPNNDVVLKS